MPNAKLFNMEGKEVGNCALNDAVFGIEPNKTAMHTVVVNYLGNQRQGTQSALTRAEVRGGGIKPWRQKGSGRARQGSIRSPQWTKGGVVFAPKPRSYSMKVNKKIKRLAMLSALSMKVSEQELIVVDNLELPAAKTKEMVKVLANLKATGKALIITGDVDEAVVRAARNIPGVKTAPSGAISVYDIVNCNQLILTEAAVKKVEEVYA